ncbi:MAG: Hpt domain-containing protein [Pseudomonadota bacterium]
MAEQQLDYVAFEWVNSELDDTIKQARQALEAYSQDTEDFSKLRFTLTHAHQINGTLRMVQLNNLVTLAEEIEAVAQALVNRSTPDEYAALEILMTAFLQLPGLLERVKKVKADIAPNALQPIINELKAVRGAEPSLALKPADFSAAFSSRVSREDFDDLMLKLRKMFRVAVLNIARDKDIDKNLRYLAQIGQRIHKISQNTTQEYFWRTALGLFEVLEEGSLVISNEVADLLLELDKMLINIAAGGPDSLKEPAADSLQISIKTLLKTVKTEQALVTDLQKQWDEELKTPSELEAMGPDSATLQSVVDALLEELSSIKDYIDLYVRNRDRDEVELEPALPVFTRIINTMMVLGLGDALRTVRRQAEAIEQMISGQKEPSPEALMEIAENIISVEAVLKETVEQESIESASQTTEKDRQLAAAFQSVVHEARYGIDQAKEAVIEFIAHQWDHQRLSGVPALLSEVRGGLMILPLERAAQILASCEWYICDHLLMGKRVPEWQMLDTLADALTSVDYYLERLVEDTLTESDMILDVAIESVAALGFPIGDLDKWQRRPELYVQSDTGEDDNLEISEFMVFDDEFDQYAAARLKDDMQAADEPAFDDSSADLKHTASDPSTVAPAAVMDQTNALDASNEPVSAEVSSNAQNEELDDEIIEIFSEETDEVLLELDQHLDRMSEADSLQAVRRSFHTLKGSGRMVGANDAGELAWSIENMLNRVIDGSQKLTPAHQEITRQVRLLMPAMLNDFITGGYSASAEAARLSELADAISTGQSDIVSIEQISKGTALGEAMPEVEVALEDDTDAEFADEMLASVTLMMEEPDAQATAQNDVKTSAAQSDQDDELALQNIFSAEAAAHLEQVQRFVDDANNGDSNVSDGLHRALHTLKGSALIAGFDHIANYVGPLESYVLEMHQLRRPVNKDALGLIEDVAILVRSDLALLPETSEENIEAGLELCAELEHCRAQLDNVEAAIDPEEVKPFAEFMTELMASVSACASLLQEAKAGRSADDAMLRIARYQRALGAQAKQQQQSELETLAFTSADAYEQAATLDWLPESFLALADVSQEGFAAAIDCLSSGEALASQAEFEKASVALARFELAEYKTELKAREQAVDDAEREADALIESSSKDTELLISRWMKDKFEPGKPDTPEDMAERFFSAKAPVNHTAESKQEKSSRSLFMAATGLLASNAAPMPAHADNEEDYQNGSDSEQSAVTEAAVQNTGDSEALDDDDEANNEKADTIETLMQAFDGGAANAQLLEPEEGNGSFIADPSAATEADHDSELESAEQSDELSVHESTGFIKAEAEAEAIMERIDEADPVVQAATDDQPIEPEQFMPSASAAEQSSDADVDNEILDIFTEEAVDLLEDIDETVHDWKDEPAATRYVDELQRALHTLKGGARLADVTMLGDLAHECESFVERVEQSGLSYSPEFFSELQVYVDKITGQVDLLRDPSLATETEEEQVFDTDSMAAASNDSTDGDPVLEGQFVVIEADEPVVNDSDTTEDLAAAPTAENVVRLERSDSDAPAVVGKSELAANADNARRTTQEVVRVPSQLLENLVNLAGETSISRARAEEQVSEFGFSLEEMEGTVERLQDKLRRLEMETEAQILFRQEQVEQEGLDSFDPLEMDRYSQLQTLSRSLMESASDLLDLKSTMSEKARDMETLLLQQSRINTDLQEGLMQSRMVPFSRLVPRLRRIVRQVSNELGKQVEFELLNIEGEMDRSVLERMLPPLEHMLRNAVDHGIEPADVRLDYEKDEVGHVSLGLMREGNEVVIILEDDGAGIDVSRVRDKAIEAGLMSADADLSEHEILQFILETGVSTATELTQISGRGVGLDVVSSEIKQLGGTMDIQSRRGLGTKFVVRLPFTVSVNRALTVSVGSDMYAIPLNSIEGIVRVSPFELEAYYQPDSPRFEYAGQPYDLRYLGSLLGLEAKANVHAHSAPLPVVLVRAGEHAVAIQVDGVHGSREVVVKALGPQFGMVHGVSGATVLGDGRVVVILDLLAVIRQNATQALRGPDPAFALEQNEHIEADNDNVVVMVVDDSVTVRKVTSRFLERQGMEVIVARDGVEAMALLQDRTPDVMLLDIEMPRMDGFEVANQVRHHSQLKNLPIIMITSRTGDKHRERAFSIGVNNYLGKPYQEMELLHAITELVGAERLEKISHA